MSKSTPDIIQKFHDITEISERRYVNDEETASGIGTIAALEAISDAGINKEELDYIIVAHNFGDVQNNKGKVDLVPALASRIKNGLAIKNPYTVAYDLPFGCPGWLQGIIQADYFLKSGDASKILVVGTETLSRVCDPHDMDSMIYSDGAGAAVLEAVESDEKIGILSHLTRSDTIDHAYILTMGPSYNQDAYPEDLFIKMEGRKIYEYALKIVPGLVKECIDKSKVPLASIKKILIHQANAKMDTAILKRLFKLYGIVDAPDNIMPMTISRLGNNSVATLPILYDLVTHNVLNDQHLEPGDDLVFASVGAGMNANAVVYRIPKA